MAGQPFMLGWIGLERRASGHLADIGAPYEDRRQRVVAFQSERVDITLKAHWLSDRRSDPNSPRLRVIRQSRLMACALPHILEVDRNKGHEGENR